MTTFAGVTVDVLTRLGLDPADGPLVEWRRLEAVGTIPGTLEHVGSALGAGNPITLIPMPAGAQIGDLFVFSIAAGANGTVDCNDGRVIAHQLLHFDNGSAFPPPRNVGYGILTTLDDLECNVDQVSNEFRAVVSVYRYTGAVQAVFSNGDPDEDTVTPCIPDLDDGAPGLLAVAAGTDTGTLTSSGAWTLDIANSGCGVWHSAAPAAATVETSIGDDDVEWIGLSIGVHDQPVTEPSWVTDLPRSTSLVSYALTYGRGDAVSKVPPTQITIRAAAPRAAPPEIGDLFRITLNDDAAAALDLTTEEAARFTGEVTDVQLEPEHRVWTAIGVHKEARQARAALDLIGAPAATLHDRVTGVLAAIGADVGDVDAGGQLVAAPDAPTGASAILDTASDSAPGQLVTQLDGLVDWHGRDHRRGATPAVVLDAAEITSAITWAKHVASVVNIVTVNYVGGSATVTDHASVTARGPYAIAVTTALVDPDDAVNLGILIVGRRTLPAWDLPALVVDVVRTVAPDHLADVLRLRHGDRITLTDLPDLEVDGIPAGDADFFTEGFTDTASRWAWRLGLAVTDPALSGVSIRWVDVPADLTWGDVDPAIRWLDVSRLEHGTDLAIPVFDVDGGDSTSTGPYDRTFDGGDSTSTGPYDRTLDGGASA